MTEEISVPQAPTEITAPQEQTTTETVQETPQADAQTEQTSEVEASGDNQTQVEQTDGKPQPFIEGLTYTSQEELVKGVKAKDEYIEKLKTDLQAKQQAEQEVYKQLGYQNELQFKNAQVEQQLSGQYQNDTAMIQNAYNTDLIQLNNANDSGQLSDYDYQIKVQQLEQAKIDFIAQAKANDMTRRQQAQYQAQIAQQQAFEQQKNSLYESHKEHKELIDLFYDPQPTIEKAIAMKQAIATQAVEAYKASLQAGQENSDAKANLNSSVNVGSNIQTDSSLPKTITEMYRKADKNPEWYKANVHLLDQAILDGKIKKI